MINEFKRFIQTHAPQLAEQPEGTFQLALNQTYSNVVASEAKTYLRSVSTNHPPPNKRCKTILASPSLPPEHFLLATKAKVLTREQKIVTKSRNPQKNSPSVIGV